MYKPTLTLAVLALAGALSEPRRSAPVASAAMPAPSVGLKEERLTLEYDVATNELVVVVEAESEEALSMVEVRDPRGAPVLRMRADGGGQSALSGFTIETWEGSAAEILAAYAAGTYELRGSTVDGRRVSGSAVLSHALPAAPVLLEPVDGADGLPTTLEVSWVPDSQAAGYRVILEQDENDGLVVELPAGTGSFQVPSGVLESGTETRVEIGAIGHNGNSTLVEVTFTTR